MTAERKILSESPLSYYRSAVEKWQGVCTEASLDAAVMRLWARYACDMVMEKFEVFQETIDILEEESKGPAQLLNAYSCMINRDKLRFHDCRNRLNKSPLMADGDRAAIDYVQAAQELGFDRPVNNLKEGVRAQDYAHEFLFCCAQAGAHLNRMGNDQELWQLAHDDWSAYANMLKNNLAVFDEQDHTPLFKSYDHLSILLSDITRTLTKVLG